MEWNYLLSPSFWIFLGITFVFLEIFIPGTLISFLGMGAILTGITGYFLHLEIWEYVFLWSVHSTVSLILGSAILKKYFKNEETVRDPLVKDDSINHIVMVTRDILVDEKGGRIRMNGTDWDAKSLGKRIPAGNRARILKRENLTFIVEDLGEGEEL
jgi:membrane protein implicated in regulation of membrane protease activity